MKENNDSREIDPFTSAVLLSAARKVISNWDARIDLVNATYPDKEALVASNMIDDLYQDIVKGRKCIEGIDGNLLILGENTRISDSNRNFEERLEREIRKIDKYVSSQTGVSIQRITEAAHFWCETVVED